MGRYLYSIGFVILLVAMLPLSGWGQMRNANFKFKIGEETYDGSIKYSLYRKFDGGNNKKWLTNEPGKVPIDFSQAIGTFNILIPGDKIITRPNTTEFRLRPVNINLKSNRGLGEAINAPVIIPGSTQKFTYVFPYAGDDIRRDGEGTIIIDFIAESPEHPNAIRNLEKARIEIDFKVIPFNRTNLAINSGPVNSQETDGVWERKKLQARENIIGKRWRQAEQIVLQFIRSSPNHPNLEAAKQYLEFNVYGTHFKDMENDQEALEKWASEWPDSEQFGGFVTKAKNRIDFLIAGGGLINGENEDQPSDTRDNQPQNNTPSSTEPTEEQLWAKAKEQGCIRGYQGYLNKTKEYRHKGVAEQKIKDIKDAEISAAAILKNDLNEAGDDLEAQYKAYRRYLNNRPSCYGTNQLDIAKKALKELAIKIGAFAIILPDNISNDNVTVQINIGNKNKGDSELEISLKPLGIETRQPAFTQSDLKRRDEGYAITFGELEGGNYELSATFGSLDDKITFFVPDRQRAVDIEVKKGGIVDLRIKGGTPPFFLQYAQANASFGAEQIELTKRVYNNSNILSSIPGLKSGKDIKIRFYDKQGSSKTFFGEKTISSAKGLPWGLLIAAMILAAIASIFVLYREQIADKLRHNATARNIFRLSPPELKKASENIQSDELVQDDPNAERTKSRIKINAKTSSSSPKKLKISKAEPAAEEPTPVDLGRGGTLTPAILNNRSFFRFDMSEQWKDSAISQVLISHSCAAAINSAVQEDLDKRDMNKEEHPEIGGFLLGRFGMDAQQKYFVTLEKYIAAQTTQHDVYEVELDMEGIDDPLQENPALALIGWFHTHPGHSLFLSKPDLRIHKSWFRDPYQLAMEMDPLTEDIDVAFFSWQSSGGLNDSENVRAGDKWFSWYDVDKWRRTAKRLLT